MDEVATIQLATVLYAKTLDSVLPLDESEKELGPMLLAIRDAAFRILAEHKKRKWH
jgi:hypothetical protein